MILEKLKESLNDEQYEAVTHKEGPAVIMAGAGSGKTRTLVNRVAYLIENWTPPARILLVTFTNSAADEMKSRASKLLNAEKKSEDIIACTYHKFCNLMLRKYGKAIDIYNYAILSPSDLRNLIDYVKSSNDMYRELKGFPSSKTLVSIFSKSVNCEETIYDTLLNNDNWNKYLEYSAEIEILKEEVDTYKRNTQKLDYDDLLFYMDKMLEIDHIAEKVSGLFDYIMVDEFQDTNNLQMKILLKMAKFNKNIMVVGDISQSIYAFRGANIKNLDKFNTCFPDCKEIVLHTNYRSTKEILDFANNVMNTNHKDWTYHNMKADNKNGDLPTFIRPLDDFDQTNQVMSLIHSYHSKGIPYSDMAIIERGSMSSFGIEAELAKNDIPFEKRGGLKFMDYECIGDIIAYLTVLVKPHDLLSWFRLLKIHPHIGDVTAKKIADTCDRIGFLTDKRYAKNKFASELDLLDTYYTVFHNEKNLQKLLDTIFEFYFDVRTRAVTESRMKEDYKIDALDIIERDKQIVEQLKNLSTKYTKIDDFLDDLVLDSVSEQNSDDKLIITTIHSAKGLEWKIVILIDCVDGCLPSYIINPDEFGSETDQEELRCFYVAITRAKDKLYLFSPKLKMKAGFKEKAFATHYMKHSIDFLKRG